MPGNQVQSENRDVSKGHLDGIHYSQIALEDPLDQYQPVPMMGIAEGSASSANSRNATRLKNPCLS